LEQMPGMERTFYLLEQDLLKPVYAIYPWAPDLKSSAPPEERADFDQALFACTWQTVDDGSARNVKRGDSRSKPSASQGGQIHTFADNTFPIKERELLQARTHGLSLVNVAWIVWIFALAGSEYLALWVFL